jgi:glycosyltransferase involved in cell wall biosynthesis
MSLAIITPVFNDWPSLLILIEAIEALEIAEDVQFSLFIIDDGSTEAASMSIGSLGLRRFREIEIVTLACNLGHQRAIAVGLVEVYSRNSFDTIIVMDCDGEDRPADIPRLLSQAERSPGSIICARRERRPGYIIFTLWYELYKRIFRIFTGEQVEFGNFCLIPQSKLQILVNTPMIWNNLAATLVRSRLPLVLVPTDRGTRYSGSSKMNFVSLVMHGLSAMAVYSDVVVVRLLLGTLILGLFTFVGIIVALAIRLFTSLAIPGWTTSVVGLLSVIFLQAIILITISAFSILNTRSMKGIVPRFDASSFVQSRRKLC